MDQTSKHIPNYTSCSTLICVEYPGAVVNPAPEGRIRCEYALPIVQAGETGRRRPGRARMVDVVFSEGDIMVEASRPFGVGSGER